MDAWIGPGIGADSYVVGEELRTAFLALDASLAGAFRSGDDGLHADLKAIARHRLSSAKVGEIVDARLCTYAEPERFFSFRRDGTTGRMATLIWRE